MTLAGALQTRWKRSNFNTGSESGSPTARRRAPGGSCGAWCPPSRSRNATGCAWPAYATRKQTPRRVHSQPRDGAGGCLVGRLCVLTAETALAHADLLGQDRERKVAAEIAVDPVVQGAEPVVDCLHRQSGAELRRSARGTVKLTKFRRMLAIGR